MNLCIDQGNSRTKVALFKDGVIVGKWNVSDIPDVEELEVSPTLMPDAVEVPHGASENWRFWVILLVAGVVLLVSLDVMLVRISKKKSVAKECEEGDAAETVEDEIEEAVRAVYMYAPQESITSSKIAARVRRFASDHYLSEESVWRMLRIARKQYALARGLIE